MSSFAPGSDRDSDAAAHPHDPPENESHFEDDTTLRRDLSSLDPGELAAAVTPLFLFPNRFQKAALAELERRAWLWHASKK